MNFGQRNIAIDTELQNISRFFLAGVAEAKKISAAYDFYHAPFIYFSSGFERLLKVCICLDFLKKENRHPESFNIIFNKSQGHDLVFLKEKFIKDVCKENDLSSSFKYFKDDAVFNKIILALSEYAKRGRYFNMDQVFGKQQEYNVDKEWNEIEHYVLQTKYGDNYIERYHSKPNQLFFDSNRIIIENIAKGLNYIYYQFEKGELIDFNVFYSHHLADLENIHIIK